MRYIVILIGILLWVSMPLEAYAGCQTYTIMKDGKIVICTQCGNNITCM